MGKLKPILMAKIFGESGGGGGGGGSADGDVVFIDYDGSIVTSKTKAEINAMSADADLPANPSHTGLVAQGWNWTVAQLKAQLTAMPDQKVYVGQMYVTASGATEIDVEMPDGRLSPIMTIVVNGTVSVDWGDNTTADSVTGTSLTTRLEVSHTYAQAGSYTIKISAVSGTYLFWGANKYPLLRKNTSERENHIYTNCIKAIRIGNGITSIKDYAFYHCCSLDSITIPNSVTTIGTYVFAHCYSLGSVTFPSGITTMGTMTFSYCYSLSSIAIPSSVTSISNGLFYYCVSLVHIAIPSGVTSIDNSGFYYCYSLQSIMIPSSVTSIADMTFYNCYSLESVMIQRGVASIGTSTFGSCNSLVNITIPSSIISIGENAFSSCYALSSITIPSSVTSIGNSAFNKCYGMAEYHVLPTTVPTAGTTIFDSIVSDCIIYVPRGMLNDYQTASNWSTYASKMQEEPST